MTLLLRDRDFKEAGTTPYLYVSLFLRSAPHLGHPITAYLHKTASTNAVSLPATSRHIFTKALPTTSAPTRAVEQSPADPRGRDGSDHPQSHAPLANPKISPPPHHKQQRMICSRNRPLQSVP